MDSRLIFENRKQWISPIPMIVNLIWIGDNPFPDYMVLFLETFKKYMPEFKIRIWTNKELNRGNFPKTYSYLLKCKKIHGKHMVDSDGLKMYNEDMDPIRYSKFAQMTDLMRLEIIYNHGGFYFDTTFEILKPMYNLFNKKKYKFIGCNEVPRFKDHYIFLANNIILNI